MTNSLRNVGSIAGDEAKRACIRLRPVFLAILAMVLASGASAYATSLVITPTFDSSITGDTNAAAIEATINTAINFYESTFSDPINVTIKFGEMTTGLGASSTWLYKIDYTTFITALHADTTSPDDATALALLPIVGTNPVNSSTTINVKTAELRALGFSGATYASGIAGGYDGLIGLNTSITNPGSPGTSGTYSLLATTEHEINEVLGLGSDLPGGGTNGFFNDPAPEDLFRYASSPGVRSFAKNTSCASPPAAYFSIDGTTHLDEFNNCNNGGDYGDWITHTPSEVQDAFTNGTGSPSLNTSSPETRALDVIGYDLATVPEPSTLLLLGTGLASMLGATRRKRLS